jgi:serine/threonine protein phosphatase PrpC
MKRLNMDKIAGSLGAVRRGPVSAKGGYFGALNLVADIIEKKRIRRREFLKHEVVRMKRPLLTTDASRVVTRREDARPGRGEDRVEVVLLSGRIVVVVADGAGGVAGGAAAADFVCEAVRDNCRRTVDGSDGHNLETIDWVLFLEDLDRQMYRSGDPGLASAVIVDVMGDFVTGASVGDCEARLFVGGTSQSLTVEQVRKPLLGEGRARSIGFQINVREGILLVATDGLWKYMDSARVDEVVGSRPFEEMADALVAGVKTRSGLLQDDVALAIVKIGEGVL